MSQIKTKFIGADQVTDAKVRLTNTGALRARNAANSADVDILNLDASNVLQFDTHPQSAASASAANDVLTQKDLAGGDGITNTTNTFSVDHDGEGLTIDTSQLALELDGATLAKSASGLKIPTGGVTENELGSDVDAESFVLSSNYASSAGTVTIGDTVEVAVEKLNGNIAALDAVLFSQEAFTLDGTDITNQYIDLAQTPSAGSVILTPADGPMQIETVDYTISTNRITFAGDLATGGDAALIATDVIYVKYSY